MASIGFFGRFWRCAIATPILFGCGGRVSTGSGNLEAGVGDGGASVEPVGASCAYEGKTYPNGTRFPAKDGCNSCSCDAGDVSCSQLGCSAHCQFGGLPYEPGQSFKNECNTCTCQSDGSISCTEIACQNQCTTLEEQYTAVLARAEACDPTQPNPCPTNVAGSIGCACPTPANPDNSAAFNELESLRVRAPAECVTLCPCVEAPGVVVCTAGRCELARFGPGETACQVDGLFYAHGSSGIKKPGDCNTCTCMNGELSDCTKSACPAGGFGCGPGAGVATRCVQCSPNAVCQIAETACLQTCTGSESSACANGPCRNGFCRGFCDSQPPSN